jgi:ketosteroid isomerase-like protein
MTDAQAVEAVITGMFRAFAAGDVAGIDACLDDSVTIWDVFTPELVSGKAQRDEFHAKDRAQMRARGPLHLDVTQLAVEVRGDVAWAHYIVDFRYDPPNPLSGLVRVTDVLLRHPDGWRIVHHHEGLMPA